MKLRIQVTDAEDTTRLDQTLDVDDDLFLVPDTKEITLEGVITAIDYHRYTEQLKKEAAPPVSQSIQFAITEAVKNTLGGNDAGAWRCRFRNFGYKDLPADNVIPEESDAAYDNTTDVDRKFKFHVRHLASCVDDQGEPVDGADRAADARYLRGYQLLFADRTLGGRVKIIREVGQKYEMEAGTLQTMALVVTYEVEYSTQINDPSLAGY